MAFSEKTKGEKKMIPYPFHEFPEFDVQDWSRLNLKNIPNRRIIGFINTCLQDREFRSLMMHQYGSLVLSASRNLLRRTQKELMEPLGYLMMVVKGNGRCLDLETDWRKIKQSQRARILREYWERLRHRKERMRKLAKILPRGKANPDNAPTENADVLSVFAGPFSSHGLGQKEFDAKLNEIRKSGLSHQLPWRQILLQEITEGKRALPELSKILSDRKLDTALKFQFLTEMAHHSQINLTQKKNFGPITFCPDTFASEVSLDIIVKDGRGRQYRLTWHELSPGQRERIIGDLKIMRVVLV
jgi:hypothetical protein